MGISNTFTLVILTCISLTPDHVANWSISGAPQDKARHVGPSPAIYRWEQSWNSHTNNHITTITTSTSGTIPPNAGFDQGAPSTWSYQYSYSSNSSADNQGSATSSGTSSSPKQSPTSNGATEPTLPTSAGSPNPVPVAGSSPQPVHKVEVSSPPKPTVEAPNNRKDISPPTQPKYTSTKSPGLPRSSTMNAGKTTHKGVSPSTHSRFKGAQTSSVPSSGTRDYGDRGSPDITGGTEDSSQPPALPGSLDTADLGSSDRHGGSKNSTSSPAGPFQDWLDAHNKYRSQYGVASLTWSEDLVEVARSQADKCVWKHTKHDKYGENIAAGQSSASEVVVAWVEGPNERDVWNPDSATPTHFTQVVWKETTQIGCAFTTCETIEGSSLPQSPVKLWACEYHPKGNIGGEYVKNVLAAAGGRPLASAGTAAFASVDPDDPSRAKAVGGGATRTTFFPAPE